MRVEVAGPHADPARIAAVAAEAAQRGPLDQVAVLRDFHLADGEAHYRALRGLLPGHDLVVLHGIHALAHAAALDAGRVGDRRLRPGAAAATAAPPPGMPCLGPLNRVAWSLLDRALAAPAARFDDLLARAGSPQRGLPLFRARSPLLHLVACSPSIIRVAPDWPPRARHRRLAGSLAARRPARRARGVRRAGTPPIVIAFGSMAGAAEAPG